VRWQERWMKFRWDTEEIPREGGEGGLSGENEGVERIDAFF